MKINLLIFSLCFLLLGSIPAHSSKKDSLELEKAIYAYQLTNMDSALFLLDKAEEQKVITPARINYLRSMVHGNQNLDSPSLVELYLRRALIAEKATPNPRQAQTGIHCTCYTHHYSIYQCNMHTVLINSCLLPQESFRELEDCKYV